jgi:hypothetical protein
MLLPRMVIRVGSHENMYICTNIREK